MAPRRDAALAAKSSLKTRSGVGPLMWGLERGGADEAGVDRHRALGRLPEVEALAEVHAEVGHGAELVHALDASATTSRPARGQVDERWTSRRRAGECWMPAVSALSILAKSGPQFEAGQRVGAAGEVVEGDSAPRLRWPWTISCSRSRSAQRSGLMISMQSGGVGAEAADDRPRRAHRALDVQDRARVEVDEQGSHPRAAAAGRPRAPPCGRGSRRRRGRRGPRRRRSARRRAARPCRACRASAPRARTRGRSCKSTTGWKCGRICPCERNSGNQSVRVRSSSVSASISSACSSASRTANRHARSDPNRVLTTVLSRSSHPGPASSSPSTGDIYRGGL